jgi:hypothetical protein
VDNFLPNIKQFEMPVIKNALVEMAKENVASKFCEKLFKVIEEFEKKLDDKSEIGMKLVSFGQTIIIHVQGIGYYDPSLIRFIGLSSEGADPVELVQHISQISFLLAAVPKLEPEKPRRTIGFMPSE